MANPISSFFKNIRQKQLNKTINQINRNTASQIDYLKRNEYAIKKMPKTKAGIIALGVMQYNFNDLFEKKEIYPYVYQKLSQKRLKRQQNIYKMLKGGK